ncbi:hypothetical protein ACFE04_006998 [Oxalis oulophora]
MSDTNSVDVILEYLRKNRFSRAEEAFRGELGNRPDLNGLLPKLSVEGKEPEKVDAAHSKSESHSRNSGGEVSKELIVKEIECGVGLDNKWSKPNEVIGKNDRNFNFSKEPEDSVLDLYSWDFSPSNFPLVSYQNDSEANVKPRKEILLSGENKASWRGSTSQANAESKSDKVRISEPKELDQKLKTNNVMFAKENIIGNSSSDVWKDFSTVSDKREGKKKADSSDIRASIKEQVDEVGRAFYFGKMHGNSELTSSLGLGFPSIPDNTKEEFPRLPPVKLKSEEKSLNINWEEKFERDGKGPKLTSADTTFLMGSYLDVPVGEEINSAGQLSAVLNM